MSIAVVNACSGWHLIDVGIDLEVSRHDISIYGVLALFCRWIALIIGAVLLVVALL